MSDIKDILKMAKKELGDDIAYLIDEGLDIKVDVIPTGIAGIDEATGIGGIPRGRITEVYGREASGKTTLCLHVIKEAQKLGLGTAFIDVEHSISFDRMREIGLDTSKIVFSQPDSGEQALNLVEILVRSNKFGLIVIDSVAALIPQVEVEKDMGDSVMGVHAKLLSQAMRKLTAPTSKSNTALLFVNQTRSKIGVMWGNPETTTGGVALKFYSSLRMRMAYTGKIKSDGIQVASKGKVQIVKNKLAVPFKEAEFEIGKYGIDGSGTLIDELVEAGVIEKAGSFYKLDGEVLAQGARALSKLLKEDEDLKEKLMGLLHKEK